MHDLASFHQLAATFEQLKGVAPGLSSRREQLERLARGGWEQIQTAVEQTPWPQLRLRAFRLLESFRRHADQASELVRHAERGRVPLQPCIRDIWHDHVLYLGQEVSGFVDFGALRVDHVAADISRLLGSLVRDDPDSRRLGLQAYQAVRPLTEKELWLVDVYDRSSLLLGGMNWLQWLCVEQREFGDPGRVLCRVDEILSRLETDGRPYSANSLLERGIF